MSAFSIYKENIDKLMCEEAKKIKVARHERQFLKNLDEKRNFQSNVCKRPEEEAERD